MAQTIGGCYSPPEILDTDPETGRRTGSSIFGSKIEYPIFLDYLRETHGSFIFGLAKRSDWHDQGRKREYVDELLYQHPTLDRAKLDADTFQWPDILTTRGPLRLKGNLVIAGRNEFYEIKPDSPTGLRDGRDKLDDIERMFRRHGLRGFYRRGDTYPARGAKEIVLARSNVFDHGCRVVMRRARIKRLKMFISVRREQAALLLYEVCAELEVDDDRKQQVLAKALAKHLFAWWIVCNAPELFGSFKQLEPDHTFEYEPLPRIRCRFDALEQLKPWHTRLEQDMFTRGIGFPGEEFIIYCDEALYRRLVPDVGSVTVADLWRIFMERSKTLVTIMGGQAAWKEVEPILLRAKDLTRQTLDLLFPHMEDYVNSILAWIERHPYQTVAIIVGAVAVTAAIALLWEAALVPAIEAAAESVVTSLAPRGVPALGRLAMTETQATHVFGQQALRSTGARALSNPAQLSQYFRGGAGVAANDSYLAKVISLPAVKKAAITSAAAGYVMLFQTTEARAAAATGEDPTSGELIATHTSALSIAPSVPWPPPGKRPVIGDRVDVAPFIVRNQTFDEAVKAAVESNRPPVNVARYLGRLSVT